MEGRIGGPARTSATPSSIPPNVWNFGLPSLWDGHLSEGECKFQLIFGLHQFSLKHSHLLREEVRVDDLISRAPLSITVLIICSTWCRRHFLLQTYRYLAFILIFKVKSELVGYVSGKPEDVSEICGNCSQAALWVCAYGKCNYRWPLPAAFSTASGELVICGNLHRKSYCCLRLADWYLHVCRCPHILAYHHSWTVAVSYREKVPITHCLNLSFKRANFMCLDQRWI